MVVELDEEECVWVCVLLGFCWFGRRCGGRYRLGGVCVREVGVLVVMRVVCCVVWRRGCGEWCWLVFVGRRLLE